MLVYRAACDNSHGSVKLTYLLTYSLTYSLTQPINIGVQDISILG
jgi:hypothetical protein